MSLHEFLKNHEMSEDDILRIERGFYNNKPFHTYIYTKKEIEILLSWLGGDPNHAGK